MPIDDLTALGQKMREARKYILSCRFAQRNNLIMLVDRFDYADFENIEYFHL